MGEERGNLISEFTKNDISHWQMACPTGRPSSARVPLPFIDGRHHWQATDLIVAPRRLVSLLSPSNDSQAVIKLTRKSQYRQISAPCKLAPSLSLSLLPLCPCLFSKIKIKRHAILRLLAPACLMVCDFENAVMAPGVTILMANCCLRAQHQSDDAVSFPLSLSFSSLLSGLLLASSRSYFKIHSFKGDAKDVI